MCLTTTKYFCTFQPVSVLWVFSALGRYRWHLHLPLLVGLGATCEPLGRAVPIPSDPVFAGQEQGRGTRGEEGGGVTERKCVGCVPQAGVGLGPVQRQSCWVTMMPSCLPISSSCGGCWGPGELGWLHAHHLHSCKELEDVHSSATAHDVWLCGC